MATYVISDIHAHNDEFERFYHNLKKTDKVYVLGDVIDKGNNGIKIFQMIIPDNRFKFCLGNHEYMMLEYLNSLKENNPIEQMITKGQWCELNFGQKTLDYFEALTKEKQDEIIEYLNNAALAFNVKINGKKYYLTHAFPAIDTNKKTIWYKDYGFSETTQSFVWDRMDYRKPKVILKDKTIIAGHTACIHYGKYEILFDTENINDAHYIDIDAGLAYNLPQSKLAVLKLDDLTVKYY